MSSWNFIFPFWKRAPFGQTWIGIRSHTARGELILWGNKTSAPGQEMVSGHHGKISLRPNRTAVLHITLLWTAQFFTFWWTALNAMYFVLWLSLPCAEHNSTNSPKGTAHWLLLHLVSVGKHTWSTEAAPTLHCPCFTHTYSYLLPSCLNLSIKFHHHGHQKSLSFFYHTFDICIVYTDISDNFVMLVSSSPS